MLFGRGTRAFLAWVPLLFFSSCSSVFYQPDHVLYYLPEKFGLKAQEYHFDAKDGTELFAWFLPGEVPSGSKPLGTIVQFHGNAENMSSHYLSLAWLVKHGYNLFTFDYRGYGKSKGSPDQHGVYLDSMAALEYAHRLHESSGAKLFIVYGQSLGGAVAMRALADYSAPVDLVVMDSTFASYKDEAQSSLARHWLTWILSPLGQVLVSDEYSSENSVKTNTRPLLVIHDRRDPVVAFDLGQWIYDHATSKKDFWILDQGLHVGVFARDNEDWRNRFVDFLAAMSKS